MEQNYTVQNKVHNKTSGAWANNIVYQGTDRNDVYAHFGSEIGRLFNAADFDFVAVMFSDTYGNNETKYRDDRVAPAPQYVEITDIDAVAEDDKTYYVLINGEYVADTGVNVGDRVFGKYIVSEPNE